jgi:hypothetical protein
VIAIDHQDRTGTSTVLSKGTVNLYIKEQELVYVPRLSHQPMVVLNVQADGEIPSLIMHLLSA